MEIAEEELLERSLDFIDRAIKEKLKKGLKVGDKTFKNNLDG